MKKGNRLIIPMAFAIAFGLAGRVSGEIAPKSETRAEIRKITEWYEAVGTVRPRTESSIEAQITAQILDVKVGPGSKVTKGMLLVSLDNRQFKSRLDQAKQGLKTAAAGKRQAKQALASSKAALSQAESNFKRIKSLFESHAATTQQLEQAEAVYLQARAGSGRSREVMAGSDAGIRQAEEVIREAEIALGYTKITAPEDGEVLKRLVEPGDLALPGKPLVILRTKGGLRLEAYVREGLIGKVKTGQSLKVVIETLNAESDALVEEIIPYADPRTRTFMVKASMPHMDGLFPGMYGKLLIPVQELDVVLIPSNAIRRVGQLELVDVRENDTWTTRFVKTGKPFENMVEVLSGLSGNETIGVRR